MSLGLGPVGNAAPVAVTRDGRRAVRGTPDGALHVWELDGGRRTTHLLPGPQPAVTSVAVTPDGALAVAAAEDGTVRVWDLAAGRLRHVFAVGDGEPVALCLTPDGEFAVAGTRLGELAVCDVHAGRVVRTVPAHGGVRVNAVAASPDGRAVASGGDDRTARLWDRAALGAVRPPPLARAEALARVALADGDLLDRADDALVYATGRDPAVAGTLGVTIGARVAHAPEVYRRLVEGEIAPGEARAVALAGAELQARHLIQANTETDGEVPHTLASVRAGVAAALRAAEALGDVRTVALPSVGTGAAGFRPAAVATELLTAVADHLAAGSYLERVTFVFVDAGTRAVYEGALAALRAAAARGDEAVRYAVHVGADRPAVAVGEQVRVRLALRRAAPDEPGAFAAPAGVAQLYAFVRTDAGLRVEQGEAAELPFAAADAGPGAAAEVVVRAKLVGERRVAADLYLDDPDAGRPSLSRVTAAVTVTAPVAADAAPLLPPLALRGGARPDVLLRVAARPGGADGVHRVRYQLSARLPDLRVDVESAADVVLGPDDRARLRATVADAAAEAARAAPADAEAAMAAAGRHLFDRLVPAETGAVRAQLAALAERAAGRLAAPGARPLTLLLVGDEAGWLPWELAVPSAGDAAWGPLAALFHCGRWVEGLGPALCDEVPVGDVALAHYGHLAPAGAPAGGAPNSGVPGGVAAEWAPLLRPGAVAEGIGRVTREASASYALHVVRGAAAGGGRALAPRAPAGGGDDAADDADDGPGAAEVRRAGLDLRLRRPVVTLAVPGDPDAAPGDGDGLLAERALPFLRAGASAVVGPWWPTPPAADRVFWPAFYDLLLVRRLPLGECAWRARLAVARARPGRPDWLAYALFGDPRARAYVPEESEGYATLECLDADGPLRPGRAYRFRAAVRARPPVWHADRLVRVADGGPPEELSALFIAPGLDDAPADPVAMAPLGRTMVEATCALTPPRDGEFLLTVRLFRGDERLRVLRLPLVVGEAAAADDAP